MSVVIGAISCAILLFTPLAYAESMRCNGDIIEVGDSKVDVFRKCGDPVIKDSYCEKIPARFQRADGEWDTLERCENVDVWTYNPGKGQFWTNLYFKEGKLQAMRYGDRVE